MSFSVLAAVLVLGIATALNPVGVSVVVVLLLSHDRPMRKSIVFALGSAASVLFFAGVGLALGLLIGAQTVEAAAKTPMPGAKLVGLGEALVGAGMIVFAIWSFIKRDGEASGLVARAMSDVDRVTLGLSFVLGFILVSFTMPFLLALELSMDHPDPPLMYAVALLVYGVIALSTITVPILLVEFRGERAAGTLEDLRGWLEARGPILLGIIMGLLGVVFLIRGVQVVLH